MKALMTVALLTSLTIIFFQYHRNKNLKKLLIGLVTFFLVITFAIVGNVTRPVMPLYLVHIMLTIVSWGGMIVYLVKERYYWWMIFSPAFTIGLFLLLELLTGSGHEIG